jgi:hypothetical protein
MTGRGFANPYNLNQFLGDGSLEAAHNGGTSQAHLLREPSAVKIFDEEVHVAVLTSSLAIALFVAGAAFGATVAHWYDGSGTAWGPLCASVLIGLIAAEGLRRALANSRSAR